MPTYARGNKALGVCDRTGFAYKLSELVYETKNGTRTGLRVGRDVADGDHPQNFLGRLRIVDPQALREPRPDVNRLESVGLFGWKPVGHPETRITGTIGIVTVIVGD
jgi:hypothetical protein